MEFKLRKGGVMDTRDIFIVGTALGFKHNDVNQALGDEYLNEECFHSIIIERDDITFKTDIMEAIFVHIWFFNPRAKKITIFG